MATEGDDTGYLEAAREHHDHAVQGASGSARNGGRPASGATAPWTWAWRDARWDAGAEWDAATAIGSTWSASYDAAGEMTCRAASGATTCAGSSSTGTTLAYDNQGRLASWQNAPSAPTATDRFLYDGEGQRVEQVATSGSTTTTVYVGGLEEIATTNGVSTTTASYGGLALSGNGVLSYTLSDGLGSVSEAVSTSGSVTATQLYGPYGAVRYSSGSLPTSYGYTGQRADAVSGLDYYHARYYDPIAGQFSSADRMLAGGLNRYAYVGGNPETWWDETGHLPEGNLNCFSGPAPFVLCLFLLLSDAAGWGVNSITNWPVRFDTPHEITVEEDSPLITSAKPTFRDPLMDWLSRAGSTLNDEGTGPEAGPGVNGNGSDDATTNYTQDNATERFENDLEKNQREGENNDEGNPNAPGDSNGVKPKTPDDQPSNPTARTDSNQVSQRGRSSPDEWTQEDQGSPSTETGNCWDPIANWWNNLWKTPPDDTPCACFDPSWSEPNNGSDPQTSPEDNPDIPFEFGGDHGHWPGQWYS